MGKSVFKIEALIPIVTATVPRSTVPALAHGATRRTAAESPSRMKRLKPIGRIATSYNIDGVLGSYDCRADSHRKRRESEVTEGNTWLLLRNNPLDSMRWHFRLSHPNPGGQWIERDQR